MSMESGWEILATPMDQWSDAQKEATSFNSKAMNVISNAFYRRIKKDF